MNEDCRLLNNGKCVYGITDCTGCFDFEGTEEYYENLEKEWQDMIGEEEDE